VDHAQIPQDPPHQPSAEIDVSPESPPLPRWVQIVAGLILLPFTLLCVAGAVSIFGIPKVQGDPLLQLLTALICLLCLWAVALAFRLLFGIRGRHGLMGPVALRVIAVAAIGLVLGGFFTGVWFEHPLRSVLLSVSYILVSIRLWQVAAHRQSVSPNKSLERTREG
jgi:hypothetical protein